MLTWKVDREVDMGLVGIWGFGTGLYFKVS
jgi:hypothetical protein